MNSKTKTSHSVWRSAFVVADNLEPLKKKKNPMVAAVCGFVAGGFGLGAYLESWVDFCMPWAMLIAIIILGVVTGEALLILAPFFWAIWGYRRTKASNAKLDALHSNGQIVEAEIVTAPLIASRTTPPPVHFTPVAPQTQTPPPIETSTEKRLKHARDLLEKDLMTKAEYEIKRQEILAGI